MTRIKSQKTAQQISTKVQERVTTDNVCHVKK